MVNKLHKPLLARRWTEEAENEEAFEEAKNKEPVAQADAGHQEEEFDVADDERSSLPTWSSGQSGVSYKSSVSLMQSNQWIQWRDSWTVYRPRIAEQSAGWRRSGRQNIRAVWRVVQAARAFELPAETIKRWFGSLARCWPSMAPGHILERNWLLITHLAHWISFWRIIVMVTSMAGGFTCLHQSGISHRNITSSNILYKLNFKLNVDSVGHCHRVRWIYLTTSASQCLPTAVLESIYFDTVDSSLRCLNTFL